MTHNLTDDDIGYVSDLVREAGKLAASMREGVFVQDKSDTDPHDKVTEADFALSRLIVSRLSARFPTDVIISEEDANHPIVAHTGAWLVDPIDGTDNYISNDGQYAVMIGLIVNSEPVYGWVYAPARDDLYYGGPNCGAWRVKGTAPAERFQPLRSLNLSDQARVTMGFRDRTSHPWVKEHPQVVLVKAGSIGLKVAKVLEDEADIFVHLSGKLKTWDTAGPTAIALGAGLDVGRLDADGLPFDLSNIRQECSVIIGRPGALSWSRTHLRHPEKVSADGVNH
ncbi:MAG: 3'(2'),5'-bisphosphate nucleotidase CysQ family protein [Terriglobales bacterium]